MNNRKLAFWMLLVLVFNTANALPIHFNDHGNYTTDTLSGLDWLDITETQGLSINEVSALLQPSGSFFGWRYASSNEFLSLIGDYIGKSVLSPGLDSQTDAVRTEAGIVRPSGILDLIGYTQIFQEPDHQLSQFTGTRAFGFLFNGPNEPDYHVYKNAAEITVYSWIDDSGIKNYSFNSYTGDTLTVSHPNLGSFLVKTSNDPVVQYPPSSSVPSPPTLALLLAGFLGMGLSKKSLPS